MISSAYHAEFKGKVLLDVPKRPVPSINAIPTLFLDCPKHLTQSSKPKEPPWKREPPVQAPAPCGQKVYNIDATQPVQISSATVASVDSEAALEPPEKRRHLETATLTSCLALSVSINPRLSGQNFFFLLVCELTGVQIIAPQRIRSTFVILFSRRPKKEREVGAWVSSAWRAVWFGRAAKRRRGVKSREERARVERGGDHAAPPRFGYSRGNGLLRGVHNGQDVLRTKLLFRLSDLRGARASLQSVVRQGSSGAVVPCNSEGRQNANAY
ncbi:hypothetical protein HPB50_011529 [Hyalomma asiaticum]|uniref:Uncharacterized protein n=1 Tax=Hyalomma asiaticum TaxID=266040 RepID=A0ACB7TA77_HYAAI|nr:hypothetical protein HPB50_011529 [Hyalomma asiaticum]